MIIWGRRGITSTQTAGQFFCPQCQAWSQYEKKMVRNFFTLYFIPIIPLDKVGEYVECAACRGQFRTEVLDFNPRKQAIALAKAIKSVSGLAMLRAAVAAGVHDGQPLESLRQALSQHVGMQVTSEQLRKDVGTLKSRSAADVVAPVAGNLDESAKEEVYRSAVIGAGLGTSQAAAEAFVEEVATAMRMAPSHVRGIRAEMLVGDQGVGA